MPLGPVTECQSCEGPLVKFLDLGCLPPPLVYPQPDKPETSYPLQMLFCPKCTLVQAGYIVDPREMWGGEYLYDSGATKSFMEHLDELAETAVRRFNPRSVLDIGSNRGTLLKAFQKRGVKVLGIEPSAMADLANEEGIRTVRAFFDQWTVRNIHEKFDLITATNVFAHMWHIDENLIGIKNLLTDDGVFLTENQYLLDILEENAFDTAYHEHLRYYSVTSYMMMMERRGFRIFDAERVRGIGGSIRMSAEIESGSRPESTRLDAFLWDEELAGLGKLETYEAFAKKVKAQKTELNEILWITKAAGNRIAGVGAAGRSSTLLGYCGIDSDLLDYVCETDERKIGRFTPGTRIPIVSEIRLLEDQPEYALLTAWHIADKLMPKLKEKGYRGKFIIPLPKVEVTD